jgi:hypothetical protein
VFRLTLLLFVKGTGTSEVERLVAQAQCAAALDTLERLKTITEIGEVIVSTSNADFAARASALGALIELDPAQVDFHFGERLAALVAKYHATTPLYVGGGSGVLMDETDWRLLVGQVQNADDLVVPNNLYSCDFAAWTPAGALARMVPPELDNDLAFRLVGQAGLRAAPLAKNAATQLDIDTPTDLLILTTHPATGRNLRNSLNAAHLDLERVTQIKSLVQNPHATLLIAGRVSASMALFLERETRAQWRILSEERGMRASGREARGEARSLLGYYMDRVGAADLIATLGQLADGILLDSRVLFAHRRLHPSASDRFHSDLLMPDPIEDAFVRELTEAARTTSVPILLGGHSLVSGGMYALAEI